jgi:hypothetical protein
LRSTRHHGTYQTPSVLLYGPRGAGTRRIARAIAGELGDRGFAFDQVRTLHREEVPAPDTMCELVEQATERAPLVLLHGCFDEVHGRGAAHEFGAALDELRRSEDPVVIVGVMHERRLRREPIRSYFRTFDVRLELGAPDRTRQAAVLRDELADGLAVDRLAVVAAVWVAAAVAGPGVLFQPVPQRLPAARLHRVRADAVDSLEARLADGPPEADRRPRDGDLGRPLRKTRSCGRSLARFVHLEFDESVLPLAALLEQFQPFVGDLVVVRPTVTLPFVDQPAIGERVQVRVESPVVDALDVLREICHDFLARRPVERGDDPEEIALEAREFEHGSHTVSAARTSLRDAKRATHGLISR